MEEYQGDLNDIVRESVSLMGCASGSVAPASSSNCRPTSDDPLMNFSSSSTGDVAFGDPFSTALMMRDPFVHAAAAGSGGGSSSTYFSSPNNNNSGRVQVTNSEFCGASNNESSTRVFEDEDMNIFSRIQISPSCGDSNTAMMDGGGGGGGGLSPRPRGIAVVPRDHMSSSKNGLIHKTGTPQISSPRNLGITRRKSQAKKVVCIPAPAAANSRSTGEVVPSDLWAWRKYGQKPIKGSPYPRGYYRCSSSKGCSARKQVERSRTDPNMLVITYTSEHNHPWPIQRNALAGSTRSNYSGHHEPSKNNSVINVSSASANISSPQNESKMNDINIAASGASVKEEINDDDDDNGGTQISHQEYSLQIQSESDDFFADLDEIDAASAAGGRGSLNNLLFPQGFSTTAANDEQKLGENKSAMQDPFSLFDWSMDNYYNNS